MNKKRILTILIVLVVVILTAAGSWIVGSTIQSPAEAAARTAPPEPSPILVPIEERVLSTRIITRGTARFGQPQSVSIAPSNLKELGTITTLPSRDTQIQEGEVLLTASGRPLFVLQGNIPVFRDLSPGVYGEDVRQFERSLERLGFNPGPVDGRFDAVTSAAIEAWYSAKGWEAFGLTAQQQSRLAALEHEHLLAVNAQMTAEEAAAAAPLVVAAARARASTANTLSESELATKTASYQELMANSSVSEEKRLQAKAELEAAQAATEASRLEGELDIQLAINAKNAAEREAKVAVDQVTELAADLAKLQSNLGVQMPADEFVFVPALPARVEELSTAVGDAAAGPVVKMTSNQLAIDASLPLDEAPLVQEGMKVAIDEPDLGLKALGVVSRVAASPGTDGVDGFHVYFETLVGETSSSLQGFSLRLTIPIESTRGSVMAVPINALSLAADGSSRVQVEKEGVLEYVAVEPGLSADGYVEIQSPGEMLSPGQLVVIGYEASQ